jgi:hypothetical protein
MITRKQEKELKEYVNKKAIELGGALNIIIGFGGELNSVETKYMIRSGFKFEKSEKYPKTLVQFSVMTILRDILDGRSQQLIEDLNHQDITLEEFYLLLRKSFIWSAGQLSAKDTQFVTSDEIGEQMNALYEIAEKSAFKTPEGAANFYASSLDKTYNGQQPSSPLAKIAIENMRLATIEFDRHAKSNPLELSSYLLNSHIRNGNHHSRSSWFTNVNMNDPEIRRNVFISICLLLICAVLITLVFVKIGWGFGVLSLIILAIWITYLARPEL